MKNGFCIYACLLTLPCWNAHAKEVDPLTWTGFAKTEAIDNFHGGSRTGAVLDAAGQLKGIYDTEVAKLWSGGQFTFGLLGYIQTHNQTLYTGAIQSPSNLSANNNEIRPYLSYQHKFNNVTTARAGIIDFNDYFNVTEAAAGLLNVSFSANPIITVNNPTVTYPYPGYGAMVELHGDHIGAQVGLFQGNPQHLDTVFHNGSMLIGEINSHLLFSDKKKAAEFVLKLGSWHYQQSNPDIGKTVDGMYLIGEILWDKDAAYPKGVFVQYGAAQSSVSSIPISFGFGFMFGPVSVGMMQVAVNGYAQEKILEITYAIPIVDKVTLNPDLQYVIKPAGVGKNAVVGILRLSYVF